MKGTSARQGFRKVEATFQTREITGKSTQLRSSCYLHGMIQQVLMLAIHICTRTWHLGSGTDS